MITVISVRTTVINCCGAVLGPAARLAAFLASSSWMPVPAWAAATTMPPAIAKCPRGWTGQNGPCGESPVLPLPRKVYCSPVPGEKRPGTRKRKEPSTLKEPESRKPSSTSWGSPEAHRALHQTKALLPAPPDPVPTAELPGVPPAPSALPSPLPFALWEGVAHRLPGWARRCCSRKADGTTGRRKPSLGLTPDFRFQGGVLSPSGKPPKTKSLLKADSSVAM